MTANQDPRSLKDLGQSTEDTDERPVVLQDIRDRAAEVHRQVVSHYHQLHRYPELSWQEERTAAYIEQTLRDLGLEPVRIAGTGVVADLAGKEGLPPRALRADIDAIAAHEATGLPHCSRNPGVMHACGHDAHTAILLGVAEVLQSRANAHERPLRLIFQPAEEVVPSGAVRLIEEGVLEGISDIVTLHTWPELESGIVGLREGLVTAAADAFECVLRGPGGHAARPHETVDLVGLAARMVGLLVDLPRMRLDPLRQPAVVTVGVIHGGQSLNVIPDEVRFGGTIRTVDADVGRELAAHMETLVRNSAGPAGAECEFRTLQGPPALRNDPQLARLAQAVALELYGPSSIAHLDCPSMGSEDFAHYTREIPGLLIRLGCGPRGRQGMPLHGRRFTVDEAALEVGVAMLTGMAVV